MTDRSRETRKEGTDSRDRAGRPRLDERQLQRDMAAIRQEEARVPQEAADDNERARLWREGRAPEVADRETRQQLEDTEIRTNPEGYRRRHENQGLDPETERKLQQSLERHRGA